VVCILTSIVATAAAHATALPPATAISSSTTAGQGYLTIRLHGTASACQADAVVTCQLCNCSKQFTSHVCKVRKRKAQPVQQ
jgi:hypothetical protein